MLKEGIAAVKSFLEWQHGRGSRWEFFSNQALYNKATAEKLKTELWRQGEGSDQTVTYLENLAKRHEDIAKQ